MPEPENESNKRDIFDVYDYRLTTEQVSHLRELKRIAGKAMINFKEWGPLVMAFDQTLYQNYPNREFQYMMLYHFVIGSSPPIPAELKGLDLPNHEIEKFITEQLSKI